MKQEDLRTALVGHLDTLKRNLAVVSMDELKTKYRKPYLELRDNICTVASNYIRQVALGNIHIHQKLTEEIKPLVDTAIQDSGLLKQVSHALFLRQDIGEVERLALDLRKRVLHILEDSYARNLCLYLTEECFAEPPVAPKSHEEAATNILKDSIRILQDETGTGHAA